MKIIILGAGQVGGTLAEHLSQESNDITLVDTDAERLQQLATRLDIRTITGTASYPAVLEQAGGEDADLLIAVTSADEVNMIACQVAHTLFRTPTKIARVRASAYLAHQELFANSAIPVNVLISPEQTITDAIQRLIEHPGALQVLEFAGGLVQLVAVKAYAGGPLVGQRLSTLHQHLPRVDTRVVAIYRHDHPLIPRGDTMIEADDEVFFIAAQRDIRAVIRELHRGEREFRRVMIAGGGNIGLYLAERLESNHRIKLIEQSLARCQTLSERLDSSVVLHGSATNQHLLEEENIAECDIFCALTNDDEVNVMSSMLAKRLGARKVLTLINNPAYVDLIQGGVIDIALSPQQVMIGTLLTHIRRGDIAKVHSLRRGAAEVIEAVAHGDSLSSKVVGRTLDEIKLPSDTTIGALVRGKNVLIAQPDIVVESGDHLILFVVDKQRIREVERLMQVGITFF